jgi:DNA-directed RNA polymerase subunit H
MKENSELDILVKNSKQDSVYVKYHIHKKIQVNYIYEYIEDLYNIEETLKKDDQLIIIVNDKINDTIKKCLQEVYREGYFVVIFTLEELSYNILNHVLVPPHRILSQPELEDLNKQYYIKIPSQFPEISRLDPVAKVVGLKPGQVCEITRKSKTAIESKYYRYCYNL